MSEHEKVNILLVDDQPAKLLSYETILADAALREVARGRRCHGRETETRSLLR